MYPSARDTEHITISKDLPYRLYQQKERVNCGEVTRYLIPLRLLDRDTFDLVQAELFVLFGVKEKALLQLHCFFILAFLNGYTRLETYRIAS